MHTFGKIPGILQCVRCLNIGMGKPTVGRPFFLGVWISHTALLHITSDTRNTTYMYGCICVSVFCYLLLSKDAIMMQKTPGIYAVSFPLLPLASCVRPVPCLYLSG